MSEIVLPADVRVDRFNFILDPLAVRRSDLLRGGVRVVVEDAIAWCKGNHAHVWATSRVARQVGKFPKGLSCWGPPESALAFQAKKIPFYPLLPNAIMGPGMVPRPAPAAFLALALAIEALGGKHVRVFGTKSWRDPELRWRRWAMARFVRQAGATGVAIELVG